MSLSKPIQNIHSLATGDWRNNPKAVEALNKESKHSFEVLSQSKETFLEAISVIGVVLENASTTPMTRVINWFVSWFYEPTTTFRITCIGSGRGSCQFSTWSVDVDYLTGKVLTSKMLHSTKSSGFPKNRDADFGAMTTALEEHVEFNPDYVLLWGAAYYIASPKFKFEDNGVFKQEVMNTLPMGSCFSKELPFMDKFSNTPSLALRNLSTSTGDFKPGWGSGLEFPDGKRTDVYGDLGSGKFNLVETSSGKVLDTCQVSIEDPKKAAIEVSAILDKYLLDQVE